MKKLYILSSILALSTSALAQAPVPVNLQPSAIITLPAGATPNALAVSDFNQDNRRDVAVCQRGLGSVGVYLQSSSGTFPDPAVSTYAIGDNPTGLVATALSQQQTRSSMDLVAISPVTGRFQLLTNNNDRSGTFTPVVNTGMQNTFFSNRGTNQHMFVANIDGNLQPDFVYTYDPAPPVTTSAGVYWQQLQSPTSVESSPRTFHRPGFNTSSVALADFNRDSHMDMVLTNPNANQVKVVAAAFNGVSISWSIGQFTLDLPTGGIRPVSVATSDVNRDFLPDLAVANEGSNNVTVLLNQGGTQFGTQALYSLSGSPRQVLLTDLNRDNEPEMLVLTADNRLQVFQHTGASGITRYGTPLILATGDNPVTMQIADVDGDFNSDIVVGCAGDNTVRVYLNRSILSTRSKQLAGVSVFPNPATDQITIQSAGTLRGLITASLLDPLGREVYRTETTAVSTAISVADLPRGVYLLRLTAPEGIMSQRIVIQ
ncbi:T9SS type A sorting domain-containing protein [Hymenobacter canadensis]|uniref:T9SS type A sorting domain-containing protein n=1 Tax=Hymenobacter canadensis TaxID=2999067 RepID=A0ABY7LXK9_9BACT|nr:T9SS type A sorting domain-containing protein [Hymenobacter canadensis]WBA43500.1 T9SS type A sorting domain-containing protein [Hymenobacter canadensis]